MYAGLLTLIASPQAKGMCRDSVSVDESLPFLASPPARLAI